MTVLTYFAIKTFFICAIQPLYRRCNSTHNRYLHICGIYAKTAHGYFTSRAKSARKNEYSLLTLALLVVGILRADNHYLAMTLDDSASVAHGLYGSSYFHDLVS